MAAITDLTTLAAADVVDADWLPIHDLSAGTDKKIARSSVVGLTGTFTPAILFGGASTGITYTTQAGFYSRINNRVWFSVQIVLSNKGSATGAASITNLPFALSAGAVAYFGIWSGTTTSILGLMGFHTSTTAAFSLYHLTAASTGWTTTTDAVFANNTSIYMSGHYITS